MFANKTVSYNHTNIIVKYQIMDRRISLLSDYNPDEEQEKQKGLPLPVETNKQSNIFFGYALAV